MKKIMLIGNGGHSKVIQAMIHRTDGYLLSGILDQTIESYEEIDDIFYDSLANIQKYQENYYIVIAIGDNEDRKKIISELDLSDENFISIIDQTSVVACDVEIGVGTVIMPQAVINPATVIGKHSIVNSSAVIEHDNVIGDFVHVSPNATLAGTVTVKDLTHVGSGATVIPNITVHENSIIGAGSVATEDIEKNSVTVGVPAKIVKRRSHS